MSNSKNSKVDSYLRITVMRNSDYFVGSVTPINTRNNLVMLQHKGTIGIKLTTMFQPNGIEKNHNTVIR